MTISIGNDHAGTDYKFGIIPILKEAGFYVYNYGTDKTLSVDYPDFIHPVCEDVSENRSEVGITLCGSGNGAAMTANKYRNIRAAICWNKEIASLSRKHNDANILVLPARFISFHQVIDIVEIFIDTNFEGGRHKGRIEKIPINF